MARALTAKTTTRSRKSCNRRTNTVPPAANALLTARLAYALHFTPAIPSEHNAAVPQPEDTPSEHASGAGQRDKKANSAYICELVNCKKVFSRSADLRRHQSSVHRLERPHKCDLCHKRYAQKTSLRVHLLKHLQDEQKRRPFRCGLALENGFLCQKRFADPSSRSRHEREQHSGCTFQCPIPSCVNIANKPKRIKRGSEFRKHLEEKHGLKVEDLSPFSVWPHKGDELPVAGPSKTHKPRRRAHRHRVSPTASQPPLYNDAISSVSQTSLAPPSYSAVPYAGEIPIICVSGDVEYASTPGLSFASPSPSPSPSVSELVYDVSAENIVPPPRYSTLEGCGDIDEPFPQDKDMSTYGIETAAGMGLLLPDSDLNNVSYARGFNHLSYGDLLCQTDMLDTYGQNSMPYDALAQKPFYPDLTDNQCWEFAFESTPESSAYMSDWPIWDMPAPEQFYVSQTNAIIPPSLPQLIPSVFSMFGSEQ